MACILQQAPRLEAKRCWMHMHQSNQHARCTIWLPAEQVGPKVASLIRDCLPHGSLVICMGSKPATSNIGRRLRLQSFLMLLSYQFHSIQPARCMQEQSPLSCIGVGRTVLELRCVDAHFRSNSDIYCNNLPWAHTPHTQ